MDYDNIGEIKYFLSDKAKILTDGYDKQAELKLLEQTIMRKKNSFMIAASQLNLLTELGFVRVDGYQPSQASISFMNQFDIKSTAEFSYIRTNTNKTIELFFKYFDLMSEDHSFYYVSMKTFQDNPSTLGNGKQNFFYLYDELYNAEPTRMSKHVDDFIENTIIAPYYNAYAKTTKYYTPNNLEKEFEFYLSMVAFNDRKATTILDYTLYGEIISFHTIKRLIPELDYIMDSLGKRKTVIDDGNVELLKIIRYS